MDDYDKGGHIKYCMILIAAYPHPIKGCGFAAGAFVKIKNFYYCRYGCFFGLENTTTKLIIILEKYLPLVQKNDIIKI